MAPSRRKAVSQPPQQNIDTNNNEQENPPPQRPSALVSRRSAPPPNQAPTPSLAEDSADSHNQEQPNPNTNNPQPKKRRSVAKPNTPQIDPSSDQPSGNTPAPRRSKISPSPESESPSPPSPSAQPPKARRSKLSPNSSPVKPTADLAPDEDISAPPVSVRRSRRSMSPKRSESPKNENSNLENVQESTPKPVSIRRSRRSMSPKRSESPKNENLIPENGQESTPKPVSVRRSRKSMSPKRSESPKNENLIPENDQESPPRPVSVRRSRKSMSPKRSESPKNENLIPENVQESTPKPVSVRRSRKSMSPKRSESPKKENLIPENDQKLIQEPAPSPRPSRRKSVEIAGTKRPEEEINPDESQPSTSVPKMPSHRKSVTLAENTEKADENSQAKSESMDQPQASPIKRRSLKPTPETTPPPEQPAPISEDPGESKPEEVKKPVVSKRKSVKLRNPFGVITEDEEGEEAERQTISKRSSFRKSRIENPIPLVPEKIPTIDEHQSSPSIEPHQSSPSIEHHQPSPSIEPHQPSPSIEEHQPFPVPDETKLSPIAQSEEPEPEIIVDQSEQPLVGENENVVIEALKAHVDNEDMEQIDYEENNGRDEIAVSKLNKTTDLKDSDPVPEPSEEADESKKLTNLSKSVETTDLQESSEVTDEPLHVPLSQNVQKRPSSQSPNRNRPISIMPKPTSVVTQLRPVDEKELLRRRIIADSMILSDSSHQINEWKKTASILDTVTIGGLEAESDSEISDHDEMANRRGTTAENAFGSNKRSSRETRVYTPIKEVASIYKPTTIKTNMTDKSEEFMSDQENSDSFDIHLSDPEDPEPVAEIKDNVPPLQRVQTFKPLTADEIVSKEDGSGVTKNQYAEALNIIKKDIENLEIDLDLNKKNFAASGSQDPSLEFKTWYTLLQLRIFQIDRDILQLMYEFYILNNISEGEFRDELSRLNHLKDEKRTTGTIKLDDIMNRM